MDLDSLKSFLPGRDRGPVLACYLDAFGLRGVLIAPEAGGDSLIGDWVVAETDLDAAIGVLADLVEKRVTRLGLPFVKTLNGRRSTRSLTMMQVVRS